MTDDERESKAFPQDAGRRPLTRERMVDAGLQLIDQHGLEALTLRKLASELRVDPTAMYRHFPNKEALLDGIADLLWGEIALPEKETNWEALLRAISTSLYALAHAHPRAYGLLLGRHTWPLAMLRLYDATVKQLQREGFERQRASEVFCAVLSYAIGYAMVELSMQSPHLSEDVEEEPRTDVGRLTQLLRHLPSGTPTHMVEVAYELTTAESDTQFAFGLDLMLTGLRSKQR